MVGTVSEYQPKPITVEPPQATVAPQVRPVSEVATVGRDKTPPSKTEPLVSDKSKEICKLPTDTKPTVPKPKTTPTQGTEKEETTITPIPSTPTATKPSESTTPQMGDTRIVDGKQQSYFLGFGWVDYLGENTVIHLDDMYENGNKIGSMGDINKIVGIMD